MATNLINNFRFHSSTIPRKGSEASTNSKGSGSSGGLHAWTKSLTRHAKSSSGHKRTTSNASTTSCELGEEATQVLTVPVATSSPIITCSQPTPIPKKSSVSLLVCFDGHHDSHLHDWYFSLHVYIKTIRIVFTNCYRKHSYKINSGSRLLEYN